MTAAARDPAVRDRTFVRLAVCVQPTAHVLMLGKRPNVAAKMVTETILVFFSVGRGLTSFVIPHV